MNFCIPGEQVLEKLEKEIIEEKTRAYQIAISSIWPVPLLTQDAVQNYKYKLQRQLNILFTTAKEIYLNPDRKERLIKLNFPEYYQKTPLYSVLLLQIPPIFAPNFIRKVLKQLKKLNKRYFKRRINFLLILFKKLESLKIETIHSEEELLRRLFEKTFLMEYIYSYIEIEQKKYWIIKKGGDWNQLSVRDFFNGFTMTSLSFYKYVSNIWKTLSQYLTEFLEAKIADLYHLRTLENGNLEIVKTGKYRYKLIKEFPCTAQRLVEIFHDPETLVKNYPTKNIRIEKIAPDVLRYEITEKIPLMKIVLKYDYHFSIEKQPNGFHEEWWIENSNYIRSMTGFAVYEETPEGNCRYADILVNLEMDDQLKPFENMIIPMLENIGRKNIEALMENVYQTFVMESETQSPLLWAECDTKENI
ncbi:MAG: hypothetical protein ACTSQ8_11575 [Candidatus Helarchaeota archaeon]